MSREKIISPTRRLVMLIIFVAGASVSASAYGQGVVPGTGQRLENVGDDFERLDWTYNANLPKSSADLDKRSRQPLGKAANGRWHEGERGQPDVVRRVTTPDGGLPGSEGSLLIASRNTGVPGSRTSESQQDDLFMSVYTRVGGYIPVSRSPSVVVRVFLPPFEEWENRTGASFALRATVRGSKGNKWGESEAYWPGIFIHFNSARGRSNQSDSARFIIRAAERGNDYHGPEITETGWWTLGMSFTPDGRVHYYASPGVDDLTRDDYIASHYCYGFRCQKFRDAFFDVFNSNNGRTWSTAWIIDDPMVYVAGGGVAERGRRGRR